MRVTYGNCSGPADTDRGGRRGIFRWGNGRNILRGSGRRRMCARAFRRSVRHAALWSRDPWCARRYRWAMRLRCRAAVCRPRVSGQRDSTVRGRWVCRVRRRGSLSRGWEMSAEPRRRDPRVRRALWCMMRRPDRHWGRPSRLWRVPDRTPRVSRRYAGWVLLQLCASAPTAPVRRGAMASGWRWRWACRGQAGRWRTAGRVCGIRGCRVYKGNVVRRIWEWTVWSHRAAPRRCRVDRVSRDGRSRAAGCAEVLPRQDRGPPIHSRPRLCLRWPGRRASIRWRGWLSRWRDCWFWGGISPNPTGGHPAARTQDRICRCCWLCRTGFRDCRTLRRRLCPRRACRLWQPTMWW